HPLSGMLALVFLGLLARIREMAVLQRWAEAVANLLKAPLFRSSGLTGELRTVNGVSRYVFALDEIESIGAVIARRVGGTVYDASRIVRIADDLSKLFADVIMFIQQVPTIIQILAP